MNTAARMESTSSLSRIQISSATAEELTKWKRGKWIKPRDGTVSVKGKGNMQTYWLETREESMRRAKLGRASKPRREKVEMAVVHERDDEKSESSGEDNEETFHEEEDDDCLDVDNSNGRLKTMSKTERLVEWNVEVLKKLLQQILAARADYTLEKARSNIQRLANVEAQLRGSSNKGDNDEDAQDLLQRKNPESIQIPPTSGDAATRLVVAHCVSLQTKSLSQL
jgi:Adenylate and Guanylate cyclase catalytic domain